MTKRDCERVAAAQSRRAQRAAAQGDTKTYRNAHEWINVALDMRDRVEQK